MNDIILLKQGELVLKGQNRRSFEMKLISNVSRRLRRFGDFSVRGRQSIIYIEPKNDDCDVDGAFEAMTKVFGVVSLTRAAGCEKTPEAILETAKSVLGEAVATAKSFKVESRRGDKSFPMTSIELSQYVGGNLHEAFPTSVVDVHEPELTVFIEVRDYAAYVHAQPVPGAGGLPVGTSGRAVTLLSGGIDSPVSTYMMARRGLQLITVHFFSFPYTSELAKKKVIDLASELKSWCGRMKVEVVPFTEIQEAIRDNCPEELFTLIMRRFMMRIAERIARYNGCGALVTGENLGQVASQTMQAMAVTEQCISLPVMRPLIGMDKEEIIRTARKIGTFELSILPYEDCCTVFTPKHPRTRPHLDEILRAEEALDVEGLIERAIAGTEQITA